MKKSKSILFLHKNKRSGNVDKLCSIYQKEYLEKMCLEGRNQNYLPPLNLKLTRLEEGDLYNEEDKIWY